MPDPLSIVQRLVAATNAHDLDALVDCFADDYLNVTPAHPPRGFRGREQVRRNWSALLTGVPDLTVRVLASTVDGSTVWTEWQMRGTRRDGAAHAMAGVIVFRTADDRITGARFFLEPVESASGDVDAAIDALTAAPRP